jgi:PAS domain S-box-containing protein
MRTLAHILRFTNRVIAAFVIGLALLAGVGILSYRNAELELEGRNSVIHTYQVLAVIDSVENNIVEAEGRQRTYLLTGETERLPLYHHNISDLSTAVAQLRHLTVDNSVQQHNLDSLESLMTARIARLEMGIDMRTQHGLAGSIEVVRQAKGALLMRSVRSQIDAIKAEEQRLLEVRTTRTNAASRKTRLAIILGNIFAVALLFVSGIAVRRELRDRRVAEKALRESEERFRLVVANVSTYAILTLDPEGHVSTWNAGAERIKGYKTDEIIGKYFSCFYRPEDVVAGKPEAELKVATSEGRSENEGWRVHKDGSLLWANVVVTAMRGADGHLIGFSKVTHDLTERKRAEEDIRNLNGYLQQHVNDLTAANRELDAFTYSLAHDLRAPIRHINGFATILCNEHYEHLDGEGQRFLNKIEKSSRDMGVLIDELLGFARLGRQELGRSKVNLHELVKEIRQQLEPETLGRVLAWDIGALPDVYGDIALLRQVLVNLISNAVKYTKKKTNAHIEIGARNGGPEVTIYVRDNGAGFDMQYAEKLFRVFQRLHHAEDFEGTGIGLAIVRRIIERHGGRVWAEGDTARGATFYFTLPVKKDAQWTN